MHELVKYPLTFTAYVHGFGSIFHKKNMKYSRQSEPEAFERDMVQKLRAGRS